MTGVWVGRGERIALCAMAHLIDDKTVAKMGHPVDGYVDGDDTAGKMGRPGWRGCLEEDGG
jgi:hypothetical protein